VPSRAALCLWGYGWVSAHTPYSNLGAYCIKVQYDGVPSTEWDLKKKFEGKWRKKIKFCWVPNWDTRQKLGYTGCQLQTFGEDSFTECWIHDTRQTSNTHPVHGPVSAVSGLIPDQTKINMLVWVGLTLHGLLAVWDVRRSGLGWMVWRFDTGLEDWLRC
jgi:hypothetical protein